MHTYMAYSCHHALLAEVALVEGFRRIGEFEHIHTTSLGIHRLIQAKCWSQHSSITWNSDHFIVKEQTISHIGMQL